MLLGGWSFGFTCSICLNSFFCVVADIAVYGNCRPMELNQKSCLCVNHNDTEQEALDTLCFGNLVMLLASSFQMSLLDCRPQVISWRNGGKCLGIWWMLDQCCGGLTMDCFWMDGAWCMWYMWCVPTNCLGTDRVKIRAWSFYHNFWTFFMIWCRATCWLQNRWYNSYTTTSCTQYKIVEIVAAEMCLDTSWYYKFPFTECRFIACVSPFVPYQWWMPLPHRIGEIECWLYDCSLGFGANVTIQIRFHCIGNAQLQLKRSFLQRNAILTHARTSFQRRGVYAGETENNTDFSSNKYKLIVRNTWYSEQRFLR